MCKSFYICLKEEEEEEYEMIFPEIKQSSLVLGNMIKTNALFCTQQGVLTPSKGKAIDIVIKYPFPG